MELRPGWKLRWSAIAILCFPTLTVFAYRLSHPIARGKAGTSGIVDAAVVAAKPSPWVMQASGTTAGLRGIYSVDGRIAWASGSEGTVLRTLDGGEHWTKCAVPDAATDGETLDFRGVQAWDAETAIVMASGPGEKSRLYKTVDGCRSWKLVFKNPDAHEGFFDSIFFPRLPSITRDDEGFGLLLGDPVGGQFAVFETRNGGHSWVRVSDAVLTGSSMGSGAFAASNSCISGFGGSTFDFITGGKAGSSLLRLNYIGKWWDNNESSLKRTWTKESLPMARGTDGSGAFSVGQRVSISDGKSGPGLEGLKLHEVVVGGDYSKPNDKLGTAVWNSHDIQKWTASSTPPPGYRSSVAWSAALKTWITVGTNGSDISRDDGKTWEPLDDGNWNALGLPFVVGPKGRIARLSTSQVK
jgi:hypothetical protein